MEIKIPLTTAVLGGQVTVQTLAGPVALTIPSGTQPGQTFRLSGSGMPHLRDKQVHGDLFVKTRIAIPKQLSIKQRELFEKLRSKNSLYKRRWMINEKEYLNGLHYRSV